MLMDGRINIVKMTILPKSNLDAMQFPSKYQIPTNSELNLKLIWIHKEPVIMQRK